MQHIHVFIKTAIKFAIITLIYGTIYGAVQYDLRSSANDPQIQMANDGASRFDQNGASITGPAVDVRASLSPFVITYDTTRVMTASSGSLDGAVPTLPPTVFDEVDKHGETRFTWQPDEDVRLATVVVKGDGGYVLASRSLSEVEDRTRQVLGMVALAWLMTLVLVFGSQLIESYLMELLTPPSRPRRRI